MCSGSWTFRCMGRAALQDMLGILDSCFYTDNHWCERPTRDVSEKAEESGQFLVWRWRTAAISPGRSGWCPLWRYSLAVSMSCVTCSLWGFSGKWKGHSAGLGSVCLGHDSILRRKVHGRREHLALKTTTLHASFSCAYASCNLSGRQWTYYYVRKKEDNYGMAMPLCQQLMVNTGLAGETCCSNSTIA